MGRRSGTFLRTISSLSIPNDLCVRLYRPCIHILKISRMHARRKTDSNAPTSIIGSIGSAVADGVGWGVGTSMAHRAMDSILGPRTVRVVEEPACGVQNQAFSNCIYGNESDISRCQLNYFDLLCQCRRGGGGASTIA
ncbi:hypothetical protein TRIUR3_02582 [Triticum urartu]|uniref:CHCH domain-containing protein n=1 Tax=Triticum urartu TaxID=4572 RepID=M7ZV61_TRIUA|nr:hypothetical protein TRIUR3_02582 [Triticum urartu]